VIFITRYYFHTFIEWQQELSRKSLIAISSFDVISQTNGIGCSHIQRHADTGRVRLKVV
jgi:hypothetical protein